MRWLGHGTLVPALCVAVCSLLLCGHSGGGVKAEMMSTAKKMELRQLTKDLWYHAFDSYIEHAYPADELKPLSCTGLSRDGTLDEHEINDVMGNYSLTLIDSLSSFVVLGDKEGFEKAVKIVVDNVTFDLDSKVQVFEVTIRVLGGLLSAHIHASSPKHGFAISWYTDELLHLAHDLGRRLLPAFQHSLTGLPWARVNLRHGLSRHENMETCSAGAGSLLLEFAALSRLTNDPIFEQLAKKALFSLWNRRSDISLLGNTLNVQTGHWLSQSASVGAGIDSFYEYLAKAYILLGDDEYYRVWSEAYGAVMKYMRSNDGFWYRGVNMDNGQIATVNVDSLSAFFPGLQAMMGDIEAAIKSHAVFALLWEKYSGSPEVFNTQSRNAEALAWPLRPELVESTYMLYRATKDDSYLSFGERVIYDIANRTKVPCGLAAIENVETGSRQDRMHSFVLAETLPYLYLLFDENNPINHGLSNSIFTTEGHLLHLEKELLSKPPPSRKGETQICPRYDPASSVGRNTSMTRSVLQTGVPYRHDMEYARSLTAKGLNATWAIEKGIWDAESFCEAPSVEDYTLTLLFAADNASEDVSPNISKVQPLPDQNAYLIRSIQGLRLQITRRLDERGGYDITKIGHHRIPSSSIVLLSDSAVMLALRPDYVMKAASQAVIDASAVLDLDFVTPASTVTVKGAKAAFGPGLDSAPANLLPMGLFDISATNNAQACDTVLVPQGLLGNYALIVRRGVCTFVHKMRNAVIARASTIIVLSDEDDLLMPSADPIELVGIAQPIPLVLLPKTESDKLLLALEKSGGEAMLHSVQRNMDTSPGLDKDDLAKTPVIINGHFLVNCKLVRP